MLNLIQELENRRDLESHLARKSLNPSLTREYHTGYADGCSDLIKLCAARGLDFLQQVQFSQTTARNNMLTKPRPPQHSADYYQGVLESCHFCLLLILSEKE